MSLTSSHPTAKSWLTIGATVRVEFGGAYLIKALLNELDPQNKLAFVTICSQDLIAKQFGLNDQEMYVEIGRIHPSNQRHHVERQQSGSLLRMPSSNPVFGSGVTLSFSRDDQKSSTPEQSECKTPHQDFRQVTPSLMSWNSVTGSFLHLLHGVHSVYGGVTGARTHSFEHSTHLTSPTSPTYLRAHSNLTHSRSPRLPVMRHQRSLSEVVSQTVQSGVSSMAGIMPNLNRYWSHSSWTDPEAEAHSDVEHALSMGSD